MTTPFVCVFLAWVLTYLSHVPGMIARAREDKGYDNRQPRLQQRRLRGFGARAVSGHQNAHEAFAPFAAAVVVNHLAGGQPYQASVLAVGFVGARALYHLAYLADADYLRTALWSVGFLCTGLLFVLPWLGH